MWLSRKNSINSTPTSPRRSNFNRHSFKNIDDLLGDDDKTASTTADQPKPRKKPSSPVSSSPPKPKHRPSSPVSSSPPKPKHKPSSPLSSPPAAASAAGKQRQSVFHRVCLANHFTRTLASSRSKPKIHEKPNKAHDSIAHEKPNKAHDSIAPAVKFHEKPNKAHDSIACENPSKAHNRTAHEKPSKAHDSMALEKPSRVHDSISEKANKAHNSDAQGVNIPNSEQRVVVYMTSLGAVRPTFDACRAVRSILQGFRVAVDERDLSMDASFKDELQNIMLPAQKNKQVGLPRVFIGGRYVGDADDMRQLSETGELKRLVEGLPAVSRAVCPGCGDFRFVICSDCNGSRKCYRENGEFRSCLVCNKNGLIRCPTCWSAVKS
ncbi:putative glutaredoxin, Thioredoxin-like superfamily [Helianthus debilis subsp. tardiflorus]